MRYEKHKNFRISSSAVRVGVEKVLCCNKLLITLFNRDFLWGFQRHKVVAQLYYLTRMLDSDRILYKMGGCREVVADEQFPVSIRYLVHLTHTSCKKHYKCVWCDDMDIK